MANAVNGMEDFTGKVVIVTGSSCGIGRAVVLRFARAGASVVVHGQSAERIRETKEILAREAHANSSRVLSVRGSVLDESTLKEIVDATIAKFGRIDVLVNNVGVMGSPDVPADSMENFDFVIGINLKSVVQLTQLATPHLQKTKGNVVNLSSVGGQAPFTSAPFYAIAKAGIEHYTRNCAVTHAMKGIRFNCIAPGAIPTQFLQRYNIDQKSQDAFRSGFVTTKVPMRRVGTPEECAAVIGFLAGSGASYITGAVVPVDGGQIPAHSIVD